MRLLFKNKKYLYYSISLIVFVLVLIFAISLYSNLIWKFTEPPINNDISAAKPQTVPNNSNNNLAKVVKVVDGDTIDINLNNKTERIRLIGMDSPEIVDPEKPVQCYGREASDKAKIILTGKSVRLETDPSQDDRDIYGRLLRYIFLKDGTNFDEMMIAQGFAHEYTYKVPYKYQAEFKTAQLQAQDQKLGMWADPKCAAESQR